MIPRLDIAPLFGPATEERDRVDRQLYAAATEIGFATIAAVPFHTELGPERRRSLIRLFDLGAEERRRLWKRNFAPENANLYRGLFPLESGETRCREGFEIGPDVIRTLPEVTPADLLYEPSVFPEPARLPGWREHAADFYRAAETTGHAILASLSRGLGIDESIFRDAFEDGISTLRLLRYPARDLTLPPPDGNEWRHTEVEGRVHEVVSAAHTDTGLLTLLAGCGIPGLQARDPNGNWVDVEIPEDGFAMNFGGLLSRWTAGRLRATEHRVLSAGPERFSIPFFFEPRPDTRIAPLPIAGAEPFEPFLFGDHLWATTTQFPENFGLAHLRPPRGAP